MNKRPSARSCCVVVSALAVISLLAPGCGENGRGPGETQSLRSTAPRPDSTRPDASTIRRYQEIESRRAEIERTLFQPELEAQRHEAVFISLWDQCRRSKDGSAAFANFRFEKLLLGTLGEALKLEDDIILRRFAEPHRAVS